MLPALLVTAALAAAPPAFEQPVHGDAVRLIFIGDTGAAPSAPGEACPEGKDSCVFDTEQRAALRAAMLAEEPDGVFVLGDLVYGEDLLERSPCCRDSTRKRPARILDERLGSYLGGLGRPAWLALGNHDVGHVFYSKNRRACLEHYAARTDGLELPSSSYTVRYRADGDELARVAVLDSNRHVRRWDTAAITEQLDGPGWVLVAAHHPVHVAFDKAAELGGGKRDVRGWLGEHDLRPDLWANGHAHFLQLGVYDGVLALTSGSGSKVRVRPEVPGAARWPLRGEGATPPPLEHPSPPVEDGPHFSRSAFGYAVAELTPDALTLRLKDWRGEELHCWRRLPDGQQGPCDAAPSP